MKYNKLEYDFNRVYLSSALDRTGVRCSTTMFQLFHSLGQMQGEMTMQSKDEWPVKVCENHRLTFI